MKTIKNEVMNEIIIERSRFITYLFQIKSREEAKDKIIEIRKLHPDSSHVVYAISLDNESGSNDDNEPKGTAGIPTLEVLRKNELINVLAITVRYFGGIKLGAGGLIRAYSKSVAEAIKSTSLLSLKPTIYLTISSSYKDSQYIDKVIVDYIDLKKEYSDIILYNIHILKDSYESLIESLEPVSNNITIKKIKEEDLFV